MPEELFETYEIHRWRGQLHLSPRQAPLPVERRWQWLQGESLELPELGMRLCWDDLQAQLGETIDTALEVRLRNGGERCRLKGRRHHHALKKLLQQTEVPPWRRDRIPLVYQHDRLRLVWGHFVCVP